MSTSILSGLQRSTFFENGFEDDIAFASWHDKDDYGDIASDFDMVVYFEGGEEDRDKACDLYDELYPIAREDIPDSIIEADAFISHVDANFELPKSTS